MGRAIASALGAERVGEVIVVDDGSTDHTSEVLSELGSTIVTVQGSFGTPGRARNAGARLAKCDFLAFLDSDDEMTRSKVPCCSPAFSDPLVALVHGQIAVIDAEGAEDEARTRWHHRYLRRAARTGTTYPALAMNCAMFTSATVIRRSAFESVGGYEENPGLKTNEDLDLYLRLSRGWRLVYVDCATARYRIWKGNQVASEHARGQIAVSRKHLQFLEAQGRDSELDARYGLLRRQAISYRVLGDRASSRRRAYEAFRCRPSLFLRDSGLMRVIAGSLLGR